MKIDLGRILNSVPGLKKLVNEQLPVKTAYRLKRIMDAVTSESNHIEKARIELIQKYADVQTEEEKAAKQPIKVTANLEVFQKEFLSLLDTEVELNCIQIPFKDIEDVKMSVNELTSLEPWFEGIPAELTAEIVCEEICDTPAPTEPEECPEGTEEA